MQSRFWYPSDSSSRFQQDNVPCQNVGLVQEWPEEQNGVQGFDFKFSRYNLTEHQKQVRNMGAPPHNVKD